MCAPTWGSDMYIPPIQAFCYILRYSVTFFGVKWTPVDKLTQNLGFSREMEIRGSQPCSHQQKLYYNILLSSYSYNKYMYKWWVCVVCATSSTIRECTKWLFWGRWGKIQSWSSPPSQYILTVLPPLHSTIDSSKVSFYYLWFNSLGLGFKTDFWFNKDDRANHTYYGTDSIVYGNYGKHCKWMRICPESRAHKNGGQLETCEYSLYTIVYNNTYVTDVYKICVPCLYFTSPYRLVNTVYIQNVWQHICYRPV